MTDIAGRIRTLTVHAITGALSRPGDTLNQMVLQQDVATLVQEVEWSHYHPDRTDRTRYTVRVTVDVTEQQLPDTGGPEQGE